MSGLKIIITLLLILSGVLVIQYLVRPQWDLINQRQAELSVVRTTLDETKDLISLYDELDARYQQISPDEIARITEFLPPKPDLGDLLIDIDTLVMNAGMKLESVGFDEGASAPSIATATAAPAGNTEGAVNLIEPVGFSLKVAGRYESFQKLLGLLENNLRLLDVDKITFGAGAPDGDQYHFSVQARTYYQKENIF